MIKFEFLQGWTAIKLYITEKIERNFGPGTVDIRWIFRKKWVRSTFIGPFYKDANIMLIKKAQTDMCALSVQAEWSTLLTIWITLPNMLLRFSHECEALFKKVALIFVAWDKWKIEIHLKEIVDFILAEDLIHWFHLLAKGKFD